MKPVPEDPRAATTSENARCQTISKAPQATTTCTSTALTAGAHTKPKVTCGEKHTTARTAANRSSFADPARYSLETRHMDLTGKSVSVTTDILEGIPSGLEGRCIWDEGGAEVVVEFDREVPNGGFLVNTHQVWIPRVFLHN